MPIYISEYVPNDLSLYELFILSNFRMLLCKIDILSYVHENDHALEQTMANFKDDMLVVLVVQLALSSV